VKTPFFRLLAIPPLPPLPISTKFPTLALASPTAPKTLTMWLLVITQTFLVISLGVIVVSRRLKSAAPVIVSAAGQQPTGAPLPPVPPTPDPADPLPDYNPTLDLRDYQYPPLNLLGDSHDIGSLPNDSALEAAKTHLTNLLKSFLIEIQSVTAAVGPTVTLYEVVPEPGVRMSRIQNLQDDLALGLSPPNVRIYPIPGKGAIGIEVPNERQSVVSLRSLLDSWAFQSTK
jgi:DNA segregation ATPase FtsK/SpoIIIE-like protein